jgi:DNA-binding IclR family transcriptional regulator
MTVKTTEKTQANHSIQVISRAADILGVLKQDNGGLSLGQIAIRVGLPRSTVQRIVNALIKERFVLASSKGGGLRLGPEIQSLAEAGKIDIAELVRPALKKLSDQTGETVDLAVLRGDHMAFVDQVVGTQRLRAVSAVGETFPLTTTANGKAVLAILDDEMVARLAVGELRAAPGAPRKLADFMNEIEAIRRDGYALDLDEHTEGISAVGAAFADPAGSQFAISMPVPTNRFRREQDILISSLMQTRDIIMRIVS